jgi:hypothetical protein
MIHRILIAASALLFLAACSSQPTQPETNSEPVAEAEAAMPESTPEIEEAAATAATASPHLPKKKSAAQKSKRPSKKKKKGV